MIEIVAFAGALADAGEHRISAVLLGDIVDEFLDDDSLADAGAAEQPDFAAARIGRQQVDDLDARNQHLRFRRLIGEGGSFRMNRPALDAFDRPAFVDRLADHVHDAS